jgi:PPM family protein phosphatase
MANKYPVLEAYSISDIGTTRFNNEDACFSLGNFFHVLADGIGGHNAGDFAAKTAADSLCKEAKRKLSRPLSKKQIALKIKRAIQNTNHKIYTLSNSIPIYRGMGTTLCCLYFYLNLLTYTHLGDSRIYLLRKNNLKQLTKDHALASEKSKNIITQAIGITKTVNPIIKTAKLCDGDIVFMCSDGLSAYVPNKEIKKIIINSNGPEESIKKLINTAKKMGSCDNITILMVKVKSVYEKPYLSRQQRDYQA